MYYLSFVLAACPFSHYRDRGERKVGTSSQPTIHPLLIISRLRRFRDRPRTAYFPLHLRVAAAANYAWERPTFFRARETVYALIVFIPGNLAPPLADIFLSITRADDRYRHANPRPRLNQPVFLAREKIDTCQP